MELVLTTDQRDMLMGGRRPMRGRRLTRWSGLGEMSRGGGLTGVRVGR